MPTLPDRLRVAHVLAGLGAAHGGPSYSVPRLAEAESARGAAASIYTLATWGGRGQAQPAVPVQRFPQDFAGLPVLRSMAISAGLRQQLIGDSARLDLIHGHGLWLMPNIYPARVARRIGLPLIVSPRGMLSAAALSFSSVRKRAFAILWQQRALRAVSAFHATSDDEAADIRAFGLAQPIATIPNGVDVPALRPERPFANGKTVLALGRIHPKKGLDTLLAAWADVEPQRTGWRLRIVGPDENGHLAQLRALAARLGLQRVSFEGALAGEDKAAAYRGADLFVLPSLSENFGLTVAEALSHAVPVIATRGTPWSGLVSERAGWWIDHGRDAVAAALAEAMDRPDDVRRAMGARGRAWMIRDFSWDRVAAEMLAVYQWLRQGGEPPPTVRLNA